VGFLLLGVLLVWWLTEPLDTVPRQLYRGLTLAAAAVVVYWSFN
jgi:hypothetical protein